MHFRVRKNVIQLIRVEYSPDKKRGTNTILGTVRLANPEMPENLRERLTPQEIAEFEHWLVMHRRVEELQQELAAMTLARSISAAHEWFERNGDSGAARAIAHDIVFQWQALRRAFVKNGILEQ